jgi:tryptophanyl-tRNA synthetase
MSKSYDNCIYLSDTADETAAKIKSAFTTPTKLRKDDPGIPEGCAVCQYLKLYHPRWQVLWEEDRQGLRGCMQNKQELIEALNEYLRPMRERRAALDDVTIEDILRKGREEASERAAERGALGDGITVGICESCSNRIALGPSGIGLVRTRLRLRRHLRGQSP